LDLLDPLGGWQKVTNSEMVGKPVYLMPLTDQSFLVPSNQGEGTECKVTAVQVQEKDESYFNSNDTFVIKKVQIYRRQDCNHIEAEDPEFKTFHVCDYRRLKNGYLATC